MRAKHLASSNEGTRVVVTGRALAGRGSAQLWEYRRMSLAQAGRAQHEVLCVAAGAVLDRDRDGSVGAVAVTLDDFLFPQLGAALGGGRRQIRNAAQGRVVRKIDVTPRS